jgi:hypothetical protein
MMPAKIGLLFKKLNMCLLHKLEQLERLQQ